MPSYDKPEVIVNEAPQPKANCWKQETDYHTTSESIPVEDLGGWKIDWYEEQAIWHA